MKVHLIKKRTIENFILENVQSKSSFVYWLSQIKVADWHGPQDIKSTYSTADLLGMGSNRVVFDIAGNSYRMICEYDFGDKEVHLYVCWIGTHAQYDSLCNKRDQYSVNLY